MNELTFEQYVNNPTGAKTAVISYRKMYEDLYNDKWKKIMTREVGKIDYELYYDNRDYYCYLKIPSENIDNFYYDVVIKMELNSKQHMLKHCPVQFFSNDPSFNYTFAHAFKKHKMTIPELEEKMSKIALKKRAVEKNPDNTIGYVKTLYFAYIAMVDKGLFHVAKVDMEAVPYSKKLLLSNIEDTDKKIEDRTTLGNSMNKKKEKIPTKAELHPEVKRGGTIGAKKSAFTGKANFGSPNKMKGIGKKTSINSGIGKFNSGRLGRFK